jgi:di- and tripeptidase
MGAQNTSIQWYDLSQKDTAPPANLLAHPSQRTHKFFDSKGPGGITTPRPVDAKDFLDAGGQLLEIGKSHIIQYAHFGYVYCMQICKGLGQASEQETLVTGGGDGTIKLWNLSRDDNMSVEEIATLEAGDYSVLSMAINNTVLYAGRLDGEVNVWDLDTRQLIQTFKAHNTDVLTLSIGNGLIFTGGADGRAKASPIDCVLCTHC